jgi:SET domain-containing protein
MSNNDSTIKSPQVYIREISAEIGRGVFSNKAFAKDEIVEVAPVILMSEKYRNLPIELKNRVFNWGYLTKTKPGSAFILGYGSMYNHSDAPNLRYEADNNSMVMRYVARRAIDPDEQLTIHYDQADGKHKEIKKSWFQKHDMEMSSVE